MFNKIKEFFTGKPAEVVAEVPYKVEVAVAPVVAEVAPVVAVDSHGDVHEVAPAKKAPAKKAVAKKAPAVKKPRAPKAPK
jgi:hypothetical protein